MGEWLSVEDLTARLPAWTVSNLEVSAYGDKEIEGAEAYIRALLRKHGKYPPPDEWLEAIKEAVYNLTLYALFSRVEQEEKAQDKKEHAMRIIEALLEGEAENISHGGSAAYVVEGRKDWYGFN